jgi:aldehyde:ferredoxin oxidoreductase
VVMQPMLTWLTKCYEEGILRDESTGLPLSKIGSIEFIETLTRKIALREGFGDLLAQGAVKAAGSIGGKAKELISHIVATRAGEGRDYDPRMILHNALIYATEPRRPISQLHDAGIILLRWNYWLNGMEEEVVSTEVVHSIAEKFWGSSAAADYSTIDGKGLAAKKIQDRNYAKESLGLCDLVWPIMYTAGTADHVGDPSLESQIFSAITGKETDEAGLNMLGERIFNLQRAIHLRQGWNGKKDDRLLDYLHDEQLQGSFSDPECRVPGRNGGIASRKGAVVKREEFEKMRNEYYELRGWNIESGFPTAAKLKELQLNDVADDLYRRGLVK